VSIGTPTGFWYPHSQSRVLESLNVRGVNFPTGSGQLGNEKGPPYVSTPKPRTKVAICAAMENFDRFRLVEWIEYHLRIGVQHFFLYDTTYVGCAGVNVNNIPKQFKELKQLLKDYINRGMVTVVPWPYSNCVNGMTSGRPVYYRKRNGLTTGQSVNVFKPPVAVAQYAALSSCYARYRQSTEYMLHVDEDEFITVNGSYQDVSGNHQHGKMSRRSSGSLLYDFAAYQFQMHPNSSALAFAPVTFVPCDMNSNPFVLPIRCSVGAGVSKGRGWARLDEWKPFLFVRPYEVKLLMRTAKVASFHIHYVSAVQEVSSAPVLRESGIREAHKAVTAGILALKYTEGAVLHYKVPSEWSGSVFGALLPPVGNITTAPKEQLVTFYAGISTKPVRYSDEPNVDPFTGVRLRATTRECIRVAELATSPLKKENDFVSFEDVFEASSRFELNTAIFQNVYEPSHLDRGVESM
jgi:hypothetical protein